LIPTFRGEVDEICFLMSYCVCLMFKGQESWVLKIRTDRLSRNVGKELSLHSYVIAQNSAVLNRFFCNLIKLNLSLETNCTLRIHISWDVTMSPWLGASSGYEESYGLHPQKIIIPRRKKCLLLSTNNCSAYIRGNFTISRQIKTQYDDSSYGMLGLTALTQWHQSLSLFALSSWPFFSSMTGVAMLLNICSFTHGTVVQGQPWSSCYTGAP